VRHSGNSKAANARIARRVPLFTCTRRLDCRPKGREPPVYLHWSRVYERDFTGIQTLELEVGV